MTYQEKFNIPSEGIEGFDWEMFEANNVDNLRVNKRVKVENDVTDKVFSFTPDAQATYNKYKGIVVPETKELKRDSIVPISDLKVVNKDTILATVNHGANDIIIDLNKETKFFSLLTVGKDVMTKDTFIESIKVPEIKKQILSMDLSAKVGADVEKGSIWDGYVASLTKEMIGQITKPTTAYNALITGTNRGGFVVEISGVLTAFMPGSAAAANKITDYDGMVGKSMEVMVESYDPNNGFVVSRKKYLKTMLPTKLHELVAKLKENPDLTFIGTVTGSTDYGIFVEIDEYITGMLHKTLVSDALRDRMRQGTVENGEDITVYIHSIEGNRIILSDVPTSERDAVIKKREAEEAEEEAARATDISALAEKI